MGAVERDRLVAYLDELLDPEAEPDYGPNGLQVEGRETVARIVTGVSACLELFERAAAVEADTVLVHHGIFWKRDPPQLVGWRRRRVAALLEANLNLVAYHLPLDRHPTLGNNGLAAAAYELESVVPFGDFEGRSVGFAGSLPDPLSPTRLAERTAAVFGQEPLSFLHGPERVRTVALVSGGAQTLVHAALDAGYDAFVTGEATEWVMNVAREGGIHYLAAGHYATERLGVRALGDHLAERFGLDVDFIDVPNPV